ASDAAEGDYFGCSVTISGDYAVVGAYGDDDGAGSAYIFVRDGANWTEQAKLTADDAETGDRFGYSVFINGDYAVVGAHGDGYKTGSAYIFVRDGADWTEQAKLTADDGAVHDRFGSSVSFSGDYAVVGADRDDDGGSSSGSAYIYYLAENNIELSGDMADNPVDFGIVSAYPNPFNSAISIGFNLKSAHEVVLQALDIQGRVIAEIYQGYYQAGQHQITWNTQSFQSGLYFIRLKASNQVFTQKVMLIR
ncbi:MAG: T9SS type A sorting domain-containing protein, partial [Candidatus Hatepunaea meridiana]|nr:T9SS type A sorting domain-containing protein [Candidatus Hatepunaea meridiana]